MKRVLMKESGVKNERVVKEREENFVLSRIASIERLLCHYLVRSGLRFGMVQSIVIFLCGFAGRRFNPPFLLLNI